MTHVNEGALHVKPGCATPRLPTGSQRVSKNPLALDQYLDGIFCGDRSVLAKAITLIESTRQADRELAEKIVEKCLLCRNDSIRIGITGAPGVGKSSLIEALGKYLITERNENIAVLAVDPTSRISGGSILGDKTRMKFLAACDKAFIRPSPSRGSQGGVAQHTREAILLCEAAGYRNIFVETVGVGQSEVAVRDMVDFFLLVTIPGAGDELQGIKRGVMEMADAVVVNKADGETVKAAERMCSELKGALHFLPVSPSGWTPRSLVCSAHVGNGLDELWACILEHWTTVKSNGWLEEERRDQERRWMHEALEEALLRLFHANPAVQRRMKEFERLVVAGKITSARAVRELLALYAPPSQDRDRT